MVCNVLYTTACDGSDVATPFAIGSKAEHSFYRVICLDGTKRFFVSRETYKQYAKNRAKCKLVTQTAASPNDDCQSADDEESFASDTESESGASDDSTLWCMVRWPEEVQHTPWGDDV